MKKLYYILKDFFKPIPDDRNDFISPLGKKYLQMIEDGEICECNLYSHKCDKCLKEERKREIIKKRYKIIKRIKNKINDK